jgi:transposase
MEQANRTVCMSVKDSVRAGICERLVEGRMREKEAARRLKVSVRQVRRLKRRVREEGPGGVIHRSRGRASPRRVSEAVQDEVKRLYGDTYVGWNMVHFSEYLVSRHGIDLSHETVRRILLDEASRPRQRRRRHHRQWRERRPREGDLVQMDTSIHAWLGKEGEKVVLISAVDDATSRILWAEFFEHNGVLENLTVVRHLVAKYGLPASLYTDQHTIFFLCEQDALAARERGEEGLTQFGEVMKRLGIEMIPAGSPQAKGRVERSYRTLQDRLLKELRLEGIHTRAEANRYLHENFIPRYNRQFGVEPAEDEAAWVDAGPIDEHDLFCLRHTRVVQNDATISVHGQTWQLEGRVRSGQKVELRTWLDGTVHVFKGDREVGYHPVHKAPSSANGPRAAAG